MNIRKYRRQWFNALEKVDNFFFDVKKYNKEEFEKMIAGFNPDSNDVKIVVFSVFFDQKYFCLSVTSGGQKIYFSAFMPDRRQEIGKEQEKSAKEIDISEFDKIVLSDHENHRKVIITLTENVEKEIKLEYLLGSVNVKVQSI